MITAHKEEKVVKFTQYFMLNGWRMRAQGGAGWRRTFAGVGSQCHH